MRPLLLKDFTSKLLPLVKDQEVITAFTALMSPAGLDGDCVSIRFYPADSAKVVITFESVFHRFYCDTKVNIRLKAKQNDCICIHIHFLGRRFLTKVTHRKVNVKYHDNYIRYQNTVWI